MSDIASIEKERTYAVPREKIDLEQILRHLREREGDRLVGEKAGTDPQAQTVTPDYYYG